MKAKFTRLWSVLLALVMVAGLLPTTVLAEGAAKMGNLLKQAI